MRRTILFFTIILLFISSAAKSKDWLDKYTDLDKNSLEELRLLRNEIYARHGRSFKSKDLKEYFLKQSWYKTDSKYSDNLLTEADTLLINRILEIENSKKLLNAIENDNIKEAKKLILTGANINHKYKEDRTPLIYAMENNRLKIAEYLINNGADVNIFVKPKTSVGGFSPLNLAVSKKQYKLINILLKKVKDVDARYHGSDWTPLITAVFGNDIKIVKILVENGADVNSHGAFFVSPLYGAIYNNNTKMIKYLINNGANIDVVFKNNAHIVQPIFFCFIEKGNIKLIKLFIELGVNIKATDDNKETALIRAVKINHYSLTEFFIKSGIDVNAKDKFSKTALVWAIHNNNIKLVELLIKNGADINTELVEIVNEALTVANTEEKKQILNKIKKLIKKSIK